MAKKKTETAPKAGKKPAAAQPNTGGLPQIDTNLAASAAAKALAAGIGTTSATPTGAASQESAGFKQMKAGLNKPAFGGAAGNLLGNMGNAKKSNQPFGGNKQVGRNQTFGADVNRSGVPRRTSGG